MTRTTPQTYLKVHAHRMYPPHRALPTATTRTPLLCTTWIHRNHVARTTLTSSQRMHRRHRPRTPSHHICPSINPIHSQPLPAAHAADPGTAAAASDVPYLLLQCCSVAHILHELCTATAPTRDTLLVAPRSLILSSTTPSPRNRNLPP